MNFSLRIWRQTSRESEGKLENYEIRDISPATSFLEMLDILNEQLTNRGKSRSRSTLIAVKASAAPVA